MKNPGFFEKPQNSSPNSHEDIPHALRETLDTTPKTHRRKWVLTISAVAGYLLIAIISGFLFSFTTSQKSTTINTQLNQQPNTSEHPKETNADSLLGHLPYKEAPESELVPISANGSIKMRKAAAKSFQEMAVAARSKGVILVPISGFRSIKEQQDVFFNLKAQRNQTAAERASVSAPPGHSEHHTGYAVDIGDGSAPATDVNLNFEKTKAFNWLQENAGRFSFEMSFPKDNIQGVSYEPWHWRYVGDSNSLETFYKARNLKPSKSPG